MTQRLTEALVDLAAPARRWLLQLMTDLGAAPEKKP